MLKSSKVLIILKNLIDLDFKFKKKKLFVLLSVASCYWNHFFEWVAQARINTSRTQQDLAQSHKISCFKTT